jgi:hypothetical protein
MIHDSYGRSLASNLYAASAMFTGAVNTTTTTTNRNGEDDDDDDDENSITPQDRMKIHGIMMAVSWQFMAPLSIYAVAFGKKTLKKHRINTHRFSYLLLVLVPSIVGIAIISKNVGGSHFNPSNYDKWGFHVVFLLSSGTHIRSSV